MRTREYPGSLNKYGIIIPYVAVYRARRLLPPFPFFSLVGLYCARCTLPYVYRIIYTAGRPAVIRKQYNKNNKNKIHAKMKNAKCKKQKAKSVYYIYCVFGIRSRHDFIKCKVQKRISYMISYCKPFLLFTFYTTGIAEYFGVVLSRSRSRSPSSSLRRRYLLEAQLLDQNIFSDKSGGGGQFPNGARERERGQRGTVVTALSLRFQQGATAPSQMNRTYFF